MTEETKQLSDEELWQRVIQDRAAEKKDEVPAPPEEAAPAAPEQQPAPAAPEKGAESEAQPEKPESGKESDPLAAFPGPARQFIEGLLAKHQEAEKALVSMRRLLDSAHGQIGSLKQELAKSHRRIEELTPLLETIKAERKAEEEARAERWRKLKESAREKLSGILEPEELDALLSRTDAPRPQPEARRAEPEPEAARNERPEPDAARSEPPKTQMPGAEQEDEPPIEAKILLRNEVEKVHPGWMAIRDSREFKEWFASAPADIQKLASSWSAVDTIRIFDAFKKHKEEAERAARIAREREERLRRGESPQGKPGAPSAVSEDDLWEQVKRDRARQRAA